MAYIPVEIDTEPTDLAEDAFAYIEEQVPGWLPSPGNLEAWLVEALAQLAGELRTLVELVPDAIFAYYGESVLGLPPYPATQATAETTWTAIDSVGYTVDAGTLVAVEPPASTEGYGFEVVSAFTIPAGQTQKTDVLIRALEAGADASGRSGDVAVLDQLDFIEQVVLEGPTSGGTDAETTEAYLARLSDLLTLLSPRPILPQDFAVMAQRSIPEIARATAIDLYDPGPPPVTDSPRSVTVAVVGADGEPVSAAVKQEADDLLQSQREVNFLVHVIDPEYTTIDVAFDARAYPGYEPTDVHDRVVAELQAYLSPATWGVPPYGDTSAQSWINDTTIRYLELTQIVNEVEGVHYVASLTFAKGGQTKGTADVVMTGVAPLPRPGAIAGTVEAAA